MGFFDKAKQLLGLGGASSEAETSSADPPPERARPDPRAGHGDRRGRRDRPALPDVEPGQSQSIEDALAAREAGDRPGARQILATIDRGGGLRTVLRAAAALEDGDEDELRPLLATVAQEAAGWKLVLQVAAAIGDPVRAQPFVERALAEKAPAWAIAWTRAVASDETARREGLVELLFADAPLARTVAARELDVTAAVADPEAAQRYAAFAHGRDSIRRFGAAQVAALLDRAERA